jgi:3-methylcrotonyl-CoA carboxylase alpha subunit
MMFSKILIANRGEIAGRVIRSARRLGIRCVAIHSTADAGALHVRQADEAVLIPAPEPRTAYLDGPAIIAAARATGAQAIHPGYGFLSENADFAEACAAAGLVFIGPPASAIRAMGEKSAAKALMEKAGVPLTPGYHGTEQDSDFLRRQAAQIGYPVLIKASCGGGGKGMRRVDAEADFDAALASCRREAASAFGDDRVLLERYLSSARHIEIQVFADRLGHCVHLFERDCSVQRRHQKVIEEAPAPGLPAETRAAMGAAAVKAAQAVGYVGAGTVEFIASADIARDGIFYFMEMNTRLQVEHPVTEMITGQDLVEWQLRVAAGEPLPLAQNQIELRGHAFEARIYAEDPERDFLPSTGTLHCLDLPAPTLGARVDAGVEQGDAITPHFDPMIAKLIVWDGGTERPRDAALAKLRQALADTRIVGVATNVAFLSRLAACPAFVEGRVETRLIEKEREALFPQIARTPDTVVLVAAAAELLAEAAAGRDRAATAGDPHSPWNTPDGWRLNLAAERRLHFHTGGARLSVEVAYRRDGWLLRHNGEAVPARAESLPGNRLAVELDGRRLVASVIAVDAHGDAQRHVFLHGARHLLHRDDPLAAAGQQTTGSGDLRAPMPGKVVALLVEAGSRVEAGTPLLVIEAMKMEHTIRAPSGGTLRAHRFAPGDPVADGELLVNFDAEA